MNKTSILLIAVIATAGITHASAQPVNFDGAKGFTASSLSEMVAGSADIEIAEANISREMPVLSANTPFMNEQACSALDASLPAQPSMEEAAETLKPCIAALSGRYAASLKLVPGEKGLKLLVGDAMNPGNDLRDALRVHLKAKAGGRFFGHKVALYVPRPGSSSNKGWIDDYNTVVEYIEDNTAIDGALEGAGVGAVVGMGSPAAIIVGAVVGAVIDASDD